MIKRKKTRKISGRRNRAYTWLKTPKKRKVLHAQA